MSGLALRLVRDNLLSPTDAERIQTEALSKKTSFVTQLVESKKLDSATIAKVASEDFGIPLYEINSLDLEMAPVKLVDEKIIRRHHVLPLFKRGTRLFVAVADPTNLQALDEIKFHTGLGTEPILVEEAKLAAIIEKSLDAQDTSLTDLAGDDSLENLEIIASEEDKGGSGVGGEEGINDAPVVKFVNKVLMDAINRGASDIHIEPYEKMYRVRYRQDGMLQEVANPPIALSARIAARIKILSRLDIAERRVPQDGRIKMRISKNRAIDFRVSTLPTLWGEKIVMRILDPTSATLGVEKLGFEDFQKELFLEAINRPYGMVLVTGPTGSGKTVTLYTAVNILNTPDNNISTAEDPVEINLAGVNQVNINEKAGLNFASALRAFLRQDPDIILVGEIRDLETAEIAIKAAQTGHMVLSTLHTNDAPSTLTRLANMGVPPFNIASAVNLIIAQRLARRLCQHCKKPIEIPKPALLKAGFKEEDLTGLVVYGAVGCDACNSGYKGRVGIYQVMPVSEEIGAIIMRGGNQLDIELQARKEGVPDLRQAGLKKVRNGITSLEEVETATNE
ncbi:MAG: type IV-A pilus assembly ATPase PilB [Candidatus Muproteobacteria bacterium RIFCSPHIGHO2_12_FULL_60_33]|uniref:Type IV-A pilus assembly ATPase PilB n=1 Tax=Candidatus Muproteobacteria bacterium RIFCSPLOWO2_01_FULL_60_18 TaxID=1817768 RepID=A0A1F6TXQ9_9PROT|nr:MAG: type IV-A pilus assembly ATPase PilB [Candidatus Muproteobacteria bacterium RIFCSPLOWO2_01_FULL_60_18]OGI50599.1 MAG: type IV-A pilus assembly ATPase PilB [Candidatus Muproteobacteria bacterium RIFCSPHIGHO2_01_60_12]OGI53853.1 MAG: type IV-A pilus assembly ATPase PilB [Candidatus Muproteobacteria bacterium RIFCSPHIGHO2_02_FULL_60_13]OGI56336.1 MAG: type IV-A pilus assembly ATPase PilB [Candidatus Muproteobacteria bacterium RIFCSPHIGHO2_12_FULL_60_33]OGI58516.1 MAG: type IV-A pilus assem